MRCHPTPADRSELISVVDAFITIAPDATNKVNTERTFVVTVMVNSGDGTGFHPAPNEHVDFTLTDSNGGDDKA